MQADRRRAVRPGRGSQALGHWDGAIASRMTLAGSSDRRRALAPRDLARNEPADAVLALGPQWDVAAQWRAGQFSDTAGSRPPMRQDFFLPSGASLHRSSAPFCCP